MRFGGHETFHLRPGWLAKGLQFVESGDPRPFTDPSVADDLGLGRNMAKSLQYWLTATGLVDRPERRLTALGERLHHRDPFLQHRASWWAIHVELASSPDTIWRWFWADFAPTRFDRLRCQDGLRRHLERHDRLPKSTRSLQREVAVLLQTYRRALPGDDGDPEDNLDCPLRHLGLLTLHADLDQFERQSGRGRVPAELVAYAAARAHADDRKGDDDAAGTGSLDAGFTELLHRPGGPGRLFHLDADALADALADAEARLGDDVVRTRLLGGERTVHLDSARPLDWLERFYDRAEAQ